MRHCWRRPRQPGFVNSCTIFCPISCFYNSTSKPPIFLVEQLLDNWSSSEATVYTPWHGIAGMLPSVVQNATKPFRLSASPWSPARICVSTSTSWTPRQRAVCRPRINPSREGAAARRGTHTIAKWRPTQALDEYVPKLPPPARYTLVVYGVTDSVLVLGKQMGCKRGTAHQLATAHGLWSVSDGSQTDQLGELRPDRASNKVWRPLTPSARRQP